jgi:hypothetical protein
MDVSESQEIRKLWGALAALRDRSYLMEDEIKALWADRQETIFEPAKAAPQEESVVIELRCRTREYRGTKYGQLATAVGFKVIEGKNAAERADGMGVMSGKPGAMTAFWCDISKPGKDKCPPSGGHWRWEGRARPRAKSDYWTLLHGQWTEITDDD